MSAQVITSLIQYGALGVLCAVLIYLLVPLHVKLLSIVENNTKAMTELKGVIDKCQTVHRYLGQ